MQITLNKYPDFVFAVDLDEDYVRLFYPKNGINISNNPLSDKYFFITKLPVSNFKTIKEIRKWAFETVKSYIKDIKKFNITLNKAFCTNLDLEDYTIREESNNTSSNPLDLTPLTFKVYRKEAFIAEIENAINYEEPLNSNINNMKTRITEIDAKPLVGSEDEIQLEEGQQYEKIQNEIQTLLTLAAKYQEHFGQIMKQIQTIIKDNPSVKIEEKTSIEYLGKVHGMEKIVKDLTDLLVKDLKEEVQANFSIGEFIKFIKSKSSTKFTCRDIDSILNSTTTTATPTTSGYIPITHKDNYAAYLVGPITITPGMSYCEFVNENNNTKVKVGVDESTGQREAYDPWTQKTITPEELTKIKSTKVDSNKIKENSEKMIALYEIEHINNIIYQLQEYLNFRLVGTNCYGNIIQEKEHISILIISKDCVTGQNVNLNAWNFVQLIPSPKVKWKDINYGIQLINQNVEIILTALKGKPNKSSSSKM